MGRATAHLFASEGATVAVTDLNVEGVAQVTDEIRAAGGKAHGWTLDVLDAEAIKRVVAEIADRAGLTKRTFFNHFPDKREVLFAGAQDFEAGIVKHVTEAPDDLAPIDAAIAALTHSSLGLAQYSDYARIRRDLIASSPELQERDLIKMTSLATAIAEALRPWLDSVNCADVRAAGIASAR